ncbi:DegT/DnrJ/EryC1/StrS family aminotransferase [Vibrio sp. C8]
MNVSDTVEEFWTQQDIESVKEIREIEAINQLSYYFSISSDRINLLNSARCGIEKILADLKKDTKNKVLLCDFNCPVVRDSVINVGCQPIYYDLPKENFFLRKDIFKGLALDSLLAVIVPHFFGHKCNFDDILYLCEKHDIIIIEDSAHYFPDRCDSSYKSDFTVFSFNYDKPISLMGGGLLLDHKSRISSKNNRELVDFEIGKKNFNNKISSLRTRRRLITYMKSPFIFKALGKITKAKTKSLYDQDGFSNYQLSLLVSLLDKYQEVIKTRRKNYDYLVDDFTNLYFEDVGFPIKIRFVSDDSTHLKRITKKLLIKNVRVGNFNWSSTLTKLGINRLSEHFAKNGIDIPIHQNLSKEQLSVIRGLLNERK